MKDYFGKVTHGIKMTYPVLFVLLYFLANTLLFHHINNTVPSIHLSQFFM